MEFSWQYTVSMRHLVGPPFMTINNAAIHNINSPIPLVITCDYNPAGCEIPAPLIGHLTAMQPSETSHNIKLIYPLLINPSGVNKSGADSILRELSRNSGYSGYRLDKVVTPKNEVYYGSRGILLDKDLNILCLSTYHISDDIVHNRQAINSLVPTVYLHPLVFTGDGVLNKALVKKALPFLLTESVSQYGEPIKANVVINDSSKFVYKIVKPMRGLDNKLPTNRDYTKLLQENMDELIRPFAHDNL